MNIIYIVAHLILPIFIQIACGYGIQKKFELNINTLSKIQFYIFIPALSFTKIYSTSLGRDVLFYTVVTTVLIFAILYVISLIVSRSMKYNKSMSSAFSNSIVLYNSGNYCIPLIQLLYNNPFAMSVQMIIMIVQNIITNTFGVFNSNAGNKSMKQALIDTLKVPIMYSVIIAFALKGLKIGVWSPVWNSLDTLGNGLVPIALITLGAQLANTKLSFKMSEIYLSAIIRLILSPVIAFLIVKGLDINGVAGQVSIIAAAAPSAVNTVLLAIEYDNEPDFASRAVMFSTAFSALTVAIVIYFVQNIM